MSKRIASAGVAVWVAACGGRSVDLGGSSSAASASRGGTDANAAVAAACRYAGAYSDGSGYYSGAPDWCAAAKGPERAFTSASQVAAALVGLWRECLAPVDPGSFLASIDGHVSLPVGIEFTANGTFFLLKDSRGAAGTASIFNYNHDLLRISDVPADRGTFDVIDASASLGPGTYQARLTASTGAVHLTQVIVHDSPQIVQFFSPDPNDFARAQPWTFRAGVCGPSVGPTYRAADAFDFEHHIEGRWIWCTGDAFGVDFTGAWSSINASIGFELSGDGTWHVLVQDENGNVVRGTGVGHDGTMKVIPGGQDGSQFDLQLSDTTRLIGAVPGHIDECERGMVLSNSAYPVCGTIPIDAGPCMPPPPTYQRLP